MPYSYVLCRVKIGVLMYYPACDSPRGFIEANMGLVGLLWCRLHVPNPITEQKTVPYTCPVSGEDRATEVLPCM